MTTSNLDDVELHDGRLLGMHVNYGAGEVSINISIYKGSQSRDREDKVVRFIGVKSLSAINAFSDLALNFSAGNINYWVPAKNGRGVTHIYLVNGCISVESESIELI